MAKRRIDSRTLVGRIITAIFILILAGGVYFIVDLFIPRDICVENIAGQWKHNGKVTTYYTFNLDGTASSYEVGDGIETINRKEYTYTLEETNGGNGYYELIMTRSERGNHDEPERYVVDQVSRAQMSILMRGTSYESMTRVNIF